MKKSLLFFSKLSKQTLPKKVPDTPLSPLEKKRTMNSLLFEHSQDDLARASEIEFYQLELDGRVYGNLFDP